MQVDYQLGAGFSILGRLGYDLNIGPDYADVTASSLSGAMIQVGVRVPLAED